MTHSAISLGVGLGGGKAATSSGRLPGGGALSNEYSVDFDGSDDFCGASSNPSLDVHAISFWFKADSLANSMIVSGFGVGGYKAYGGFGISAAGDIRWDDGNYGTKFGSGFLSTNTWYHYCASFKASGYTLTDGTASNNGKGYEVYIDGVRRDAAFSSASAASYNYGLSETTDKFKVGREGERAVYLFNGKVDEVAVFGSSLSSSQVTAIYNAGIPGDLTDYSPTLWWRMGDNDGGTGTTITDQGSGGNNGTLTNGPTYSTDTP